MLIICSLPIRSICISMVGIGELSKQHEAALAHGNHRQLYMSFSRSNVTIPLPSGSCKYVYASHFLEHLNYFDTVDAMLREFQRLLAPGGVLRLVVPDAVVWLKHYTQGIDSNMKRVRPSFTGPLWEKAC